MKEELNKLGGLVNNAVLWGSFLSLLTEKIESTRKALERADDVKEIHRLQGELRAFRFMAGLRELANGIHR